MQPPLDAPVADLAPASERLTACDKEHLITYLRLLDADEGGLDWAEASRVILHIDPDGDPGRARRAYDSHLKRSREMTEFGYRLLLRGQFQARARLMRATEKPAEVFAAGFAAERPLTYFDYYASASNPPFRALLIR